MNTEQLTKICSNDKHIRKLFLGVFSADTLPLSISLPSCLIVNTDPSSLPGEHWVAIYFDVKNVAHYFCSYGKRVQSLIKAWLDYHNLTYFCYPNYRIQSPYSTTCGQYVLLYLHFVCRGVSPRIISSLFTKNVTENDIIVTTFINCIYKAEIPIIDTNFLLDQL